MIERSAAEPALSPEVLAEIRSVGGERLVAEMLEIFSGRTPARLVAAAQAVAAGDLEAAARALHSLRSASATIGARRLAEAAGALERAARRDDAAELESGMARLERLTAAAVAAAVAAARTAAQREPGGA